MNRLQLLPGHRACRKLLPWYVNGTLDAADRDRVEGHLKDCAACRGETAALEELRQSVRETPAESAAVVPSFGKVLARIDADAAPRWRTPWTVRWALAAQAAAILLLVALLVWPAAPESPESFQTLSDPRGGTVSGAPSLRVVFRETATEAELRRLLRSIEAEIVGGPSSVGAYTVRGSAGRGRGDRAALLARLRADALVRLAEPVVEGSD